MVACWTTGDGTWIGTKWMDSRGIQKIESRGPEEEERLEDDSPV